MNLEELTAEALKLKKVYEEYDIAKSIKPWGMEQVYESLVSDVGDLGRVIQAEEGLREMPATDKNLSHELAEILWAILLLAKHYDINLTEAFQDEMRNRIESHRVNE